MPAPAPLVLRAGAPLVGWCTALVVAGCRSPGSAAVAITRDAVTGDATAREEAVRSPACLPYDVSGYTGCAEIRGTVAGRRGRPLAGISVGTSGQVVAQAHALFSASYVRTDTTGTFRLWMVRVVARPPAAGPDTASFWVVAADPRTAGLNAPARVRDSVLIRVTVSPPGEVPQPARVRLTLPAP